MQCAVRSEESGIKSPIVWPISSIEKRAQLIRANVGITVKPIEGRSTSGKVKQNKERNRLVCRL